MSNPTFYSVALTTDAPRVRVSSPKVRASFDTMPGVDGAYVQPFGRSTRTIAVSGLLIASGASADAAHTAWWTAYRIIETLADGATVGDLANVGGKTYGTCMLTGYTHGPIGISKAGASYEAIAQVSATITQLDPTDVNS